MQGSRTTIDIVHLSCPPSSCYDTSNSREGGFIDNEMWLFDNNNNSCVDPNGHPGVCWVEGGYLTVTNSPNATTENYFWADLRPSFTIGGLTFGSNFNLHILSQVPQGDYGHQVDILIYSGTTHVCIPPASPPYGGCIPPITDEYFVSFSSPNFRSVSLSTHNAMHPNRFDVGQELAGAGGASAPTAHFTNNSFATFTSGLAGVRYTPEGADGIPFLSVSGAPPPTVGYTTKPSQAPGTGGNIYSNCC